MMVQGQELLVVGEFTGTGGDAGAQQACPHKEGEGLHVEAGRGWMFDRKLGVLITTNV